MALHLQSRRAQALDDTPVLVVPNVRHNGFGNLFSHIFHFGQFLLCRCTQQVDGRVGFRQFLRCRFSHKTYAKGKEHAAPGHLFALFQPRHQPVGRFVSKARQGSYVVAIQVVDVGDVPDPALLVEQVDGLRPQSVDIHRLAADEMFHLAFLLGLTAALVGTAPGRFSFHTHQRRPAFGTGADELHRTGVSCAFPRLYGRNLGDNLSAFLHPDKVTFVQVERAHEIFVIEGGAFDDSAAQEDRFHVRHRSHGARAAYLITD